MSTSTPSTSLRSLKGRPSSGSGSASSARRGQRAPPTTSPCDCGAGQQKGTASPASRAGRDRRVAPAPTAQAGERLHATGVRVSRLLAQVFACRLRFDAALAQGRVVPVRILQKSITKPSPKIDATAGLGAASTRIARRTIGRGRRRRFSFRPIARSAICTAWLRLSGSGPPNSISSGGSSSSATAATSAATSSLETKRRSMSPLPRMPTRPRRMSNWPNGCEVYVLERVRSDDHRAEG